jgi:ABC-type oligopeptide transport system ATPase subunit
MQLPLDFSYLTAYTFWMLKKLKEVILIKGASGSGKTTLANLIAGLHPFYRGSVVCEADQYFETKGKEFHYSLLNEAHEYCRNKFQQAIKDNIEVIIVSNTSTRESETKFYIDLAKKEGYKVTSLVVENINGTKNIHNVPEKTLADQKARLMASIKL